MAFRHRNISPRYYPIEAIFTPCYDKVTTFTFTCYMDFSLQYFFPRDPPFVAMYTPWDYDTVFTTVTPSTFTFPISSKFYWFLIQKWTLSLWDYHYFERDTTKFNRNGKMKNQVRSNTLDSKKYPMPQTAYCTILVTK